MSWASEVFSEHLAQRRGVREQQIIGILKEEQTRLAVAEIGRWHGISDATFYTWR